MTRRDEIIAQAQQINALPTTAVELLAAMQREDISMDRIATLIEHEPAVAANLLKLANSTASSTREPITSVKQAAVRMGVRQTTELLLDLVVAPAAGKPVRGYDLPAGKLWEHSAAVAIVTDVLAEDLHTTSPIEAFTAGLLHDIGKLVLGHFVEVEFEPIRDVAFGQDISFEQAERQVLGIDHAEVGAVLLDSWGIGGMVRDAVRWHHEPDRAPEPSRAVTRWVHAAVQIVTASGIGGGSDGSQYQTSDLTLEELDIQPKRVERAMCELVERLEVIKDLGQQVNQNTGSNLS